MDIQGRVMQDGKQVIVDRQKYNDYFRTYRKSRKYLDYHRAYNYQWRHAHKSKKDAIRFKVCRAIKKGLLKREPCYCGITTVEAHHKDYRSPLKVTWLCRPHHREADIKEGRRTF